MSESKLRIIPLGGLGEVGKNMMAFVYDDQAIIIDTGIMFPESDMLGIDYIIPDFRYLTQKANLTVRGILVTHGHEDHTGAIQHVAAAFPTAPIYATPLTRGLLEVKLKQARLLDQVEMFTFQTGDILNIGPFQVETFHVCHSIPDGVGLGIVTPAGLIVHSGDFKFDHTPVDGKPPDFAKLAEFSARGVLALLSDSTNADRPGWTPSEAVIDHAFDRVFRQASGRIIVATFASLISRIQQVAWAAQRYNRKMAVAGHTMMDNIRMAIKLGYLDLPSDLMISVDEASKRPPNEIAIMATGTQGEPSAVLGRLATGQHSQLASQPGDTGIMSAHPIPGNEEGVHRTVNRLIQRGASVVYDPIEQVHVSGHASQEEQKLLINLVRPRYFIPIHGELRHLKQHARLAEQVGIQADKIAVVENGTILCFDHEGTMTLGERIPGGYVFVDGAGVGDISPAVIRDREHLGRDGVVIVNVLVDRQSRECAREPEIISRGFVYEPQANTLIENAREIVKRTIKQQPDANGRRADMIRDALGRMLYNETKRRPVIFAFVNDI